MAKCAQCGFSPSEKNRSNNQNKYYWGVVLPVISDHTGFTIEEMHEVLKYKFLKKWKTLKGIVAEYVGSTTLLDTKSFEEYMTKIRQFASIELCCYIPEPNEPPIDNG